MRLLLDTHAFLWYISADSRLPTVWQNAIRDPGNEICLSVVSLWEIIVKQRLGKLPLPEPAETYIPAQRNKHQIECLELDEQSVTLLAQLPSLHRDPFDRMLVCQAIRHGLIILSADPLLKKYPVSVFQPS